MKKAFTLMELLIVVIIIGIIIAAIWRMFSYKQINRANFDTCYVKIYGKLDKFFQEALSQKGVLTGGKYIAPNYYNVIFDKSNQQIILDYSWVVKKPIKLVGNWVDEINKCYTRTYHTFLSWDISKVKIKAGLQVDNSTTSESPMELYSWTDKLSSSHTGVVYFYYCDHPSNNNCLQKYKLIIDPRSYLFKSYFCLKLGANWTCEKWSE